jgi:NACHT domain
MLDQDTIEQQQVLLVENRRRLAVLLQQQTRLGDYAPPHIRLEIEDTQAAIRNLKGTLRAAGSAVEDEPNDDIIPAAVLAPSRLSPQEQRNRNRMLDKVEAFWIKGVLEQSLYQMARVELDFEHAPAQVSHPWETVLHQANQPNQTIPAGKSVIAVFDDLLGELLILGAPGAGKTTMLLELTRDLIARARTNEPHPIPVVFNLSTWTTKRQPLGTWLAEELNQRYDVPKTLAQEWVAANALLPLLDGLDEVAAEHRDGCVAAINAFRTAAGFVPLAVCSRIADYEALEGKLRLQGAIVIQPLTKGQVDDYLKRVGRPLAAVRAALRDDATLWELMDNPLMLSIVALAYKDTSAAKLRALGTPAERRRQLFDDYIAAMFVRPGQSAKTPYTEDDTIYWLAWLAGKMVEHNQTVLYVERMQPSWLGRVGRRGFALRVGLLIALACGLIGGLGYGLDFRLLSSLSTRNMFIGGVPMIQPLGGLRGGSLGVLLGGLLAALLAGVAGGVSSYLAEIRPVETLRWSWTAAGAGWRSSLVGALVGGLGYGLSFGLFGWLTVLSVGFDNGLVIGLSSGLSFGLDAALAGWILGWLVGETTDGQPTGRTIVERFQRHRVVWQMLAFGLLTGLSFWLLSGLLVGPLNERWPGFGLGYQLQTGLRGSLLGGLVGGLATYDMSTRTVDRDGFRRASWLALASGLVCGLGFGLLGGLQGMLSGGLGGTIVGWLASWLGGHDRTHQPTLNNTALRRFARNALAVGLVYGLVGGLVHFAGGSDRLASGLRSGLSFGLSGAFFGGLLSGLIEGDISTRTVTNEGIRRSLRSAAVSGLAGGLGSGLVICLLVGLESAQLFGLESALVVGLIVGLSVGLGVGLGVGLLYGGATVIQHYTLCWMLSRNGSLPLRLIRFLDYCVECIFLRKVGGGYIFVHRLLMEHFASLLGRSADE